MANKLKRCVIGQNKDYLITIISEASDRTGDKLLAFMDKYHLTNLQEATEAQLESFILDDLPKMGGTHGRTTEIGG